MSTATLAASAFAKAYAQVPVDVTGYRSVASVAATAGVPYLIAAKAAAALCRAGKAGLAGPITDTRVVLAACPA